MARPTTLADVREGDELVVVTSAVLRKQPPSYRVTEVMKTTAKTITVRGNDSYDRDGEPHGRSTSKITRLVAWSPEIEAKVAEQKAAREVESREREARASATQERDAARSQAVAEWLATHSAAEILSGVSNGLLASEVYESLTSRGLIAAIETN